MHVLLVGRVQGVGWAASLYTIMHLELPSPLMLAQRCSISTCTADQHCMTLTSSTSTHKCLCIALVTHALFDKGNCLACSHALWATVALVLLGPKCLTLPV